MKKYFFAVAAALMLFTVPAGAAQFDPPELDTSLLRDRLLLYVPNRIADLFDIFSVNLGVGPVVEARLMCTRLCDIGAGWGLSYKMYKDFNRQYGFGVEEGWYWSFIFVSEEEFLLSDGTDLVRKYEESRAGVPALDTRTYDFFTGARDYWAIGGSLACGIDGDLYIHPTEWLDLGLGFFLIDPRNDDFILADFQ